MSDDEVTPRQRDPNIDHRRRPHSEVVRDRIRASGIIARLVKHVFGEIELSATQVRSAEILLKKVVPDLKQIEHTGAIEYRNVRDLTDAELIAIAARGLARADDEAQGADESRSVHGLLNS
jgi:hypothetical protein